MCKVLEDGDLADKLLWGFSGGEDCTLTQLCIVMHCPASQNAHISFKASHIRNSFVPSNSSSFIFVGHLLLIRQQAHMGAIVEKDTDCMV